MKIYISSTAATIPYEGTGSAISSEDEEAIRTILADLETGYETQDADLILQHISDSIKDQIADELSIIFPGFSSISINLLDYTIVGNLPYAEIEHIENYQNVYEIDWTSNDDSWGGSSCDALYFYFEKAADTWRIYYIEKAFNSMRIYCTIASD